MLLAKRIIFSSSLSVCSFYDVVIILNLQPYINFRDNSPHCHESKTTVALWLTPVLEKLEERKYSFK